MVRVLAGYARSTGGLLVAEGVETEAELAEVRAAGVPLVQGYLLARPGAPWPDVSYEQARGIPTGSAESQAHLAGAKRAQFVGGGADE